MSTIKCNCEECKIFLNDQKIYYSVFCGCEDCRQAAEWGNSHGSPLPDKLQKLIYVRSDIKKVEGEKYMHAYQLRDYARSTRIYCVKCFSIIGVDHPGYKNAVFMLIPQLCKTDLDLTIKPVAALFMKDYAYEDRSKISVDILVMDDFLTEDINNNYHTLMKPLTPQNKDLEGITFRELIKKVKGVTVLNLKKGESFINK